MPLYTSPATAPATVNRVQDIRAEGDLWYVWFVETDGLISITKFERLAEARAWAAQVDPFYGLV